MKFKKQSFFEDQLLAEEKIIWEAAPSFWLLDTEGFFEFNLEKIFRFILAALRFEIILSVIVIPMIIGYLIFYVLNWKLKILVIFIFGLIAFMKYKRIKNSRYAYSNQRIFISIWHWGKRTTNTIHYSELGKVTTELYGNGGGIIHFLPKKPFDFVGKALLSGFNRHYPTIEFVGNIEIIAEDIRAIHRSGFLSR